MNRWKVVKKLKTPTNSAGKQNSTPIESGSKLKIEEIVKILLENRGIKTKKEIEEFLNPVLEAVTMKNVGIDLAEVRKGIQLIKKTIDEKKAIVIYGDYDVDGVTGTAILWETLYSFYKNSHPYIPHRVDEGYGLSVKGIQNLKLKTQNCGLIITVDNGIVANKAVEFAHKSGIDIIITDHHVKGKNLPKAESIIHTTNLCGAGVAYLFAQEIISKCHPERSEGSILTGDSSAKPQNDVKDSHLELVALATVADLVPLQKYNRTLLKFGLEKLRETARPGLEFLFEIAQIKKNEIDTYQIGHVIAPRINASGRISHALDSLRLICTSNKSRAKQLATALNDVNKVRQDLTFDSTQIAVDEIKSSKSKIKNILVVEDEKYEQGVIGLIASRLVEEFYRPAIAISVGKEYSKGSARSITGVNIIELIRSSLEFLEDAGGHPMAAGFTIKTKNLKAFKNAIIKKADEINSKLFDRELKIDLELPFENITIELFDEIQKLKPFGMGNSTPVFMTEKVQVRSAQYVGKEKNHLQLVLEQNGASFKAMLFRHDKNKEIKIGDVIDIVYALEKNEWNGSLKIEIKLKDVAILVPWEIEGVLVQ